MRLLVKHLAKSFLMQNNSKTVSPMIYFIHFSAKGSKISIVNRDNYLFPVIPQKRIFLSFYIKWRHLLMFIIISSFNTPVKVISSNTFLSTLVLNFFKKCYFIYNSHKKGVTLMIYRSNITYIFFKEPFNVFLEGQTSEDKSTPLLAIKHYSSLNLVIFFRTIIIL